MPVAPKKPAAPAPKLSKQEREALRQQQRAQEQMAALEANAARLDKLKTWAMGRLKGLLELDDETARQSASYLLTLSDDDLLKWEVNYFQQSVGFANEYIKERQRLKLQTLAPQKREEGDKKKDTTAAKAERKEQKQQRQRDAIYKTAEPDDASDAGRTSRELGQGGTSHRTGSPTPSATSASTSGGSKKKYSKIGGITDIQKMDVLIPGVFMPCNCEARRHKLIQNCVNCGKIICEQEGRGPCSFCGIPLGTQPLSAKQVKEALDKGELAEFEKKRLQDLQRALAQRDRLLHYEATKAKRTTVIDDQVDYFESTSNQWLSVEERLEAAQRAQEALDAKEEANRKGGAYTIDIDLTRGLASVKEKPKGLSPAELQAMREEERKREEAQWDPENQVENAKAMLKNEEGGGGEDEDENDEEGVQGEGNIFVSDMYRAALVGKKAEEDEEDQEFKEKVKNPRILPHPKLQQAIPFTPEDAEEGETTEKKKKKQSTEQEKEPVIRKAKQGNVQNDYWEEDEKVYKSTRQPKTQAWVYVNSPIVKTWPPVPDRGMCLSMHQPWASLLVHGIKKHEGRTWPTDHRGRLWIHAAAHEPAPHDIRTVENFYRGRGTTRFPTHYPTSVLLGCVTVTDCLHTDDYKVQIPPKDQESESDYVFICTHAQLLVVPLKMEGKHKIYQLDKKIWAAARTQAGEAGA